MSVLPESGSIVELFGVGCEGCGHFHGHFKVQSVEDGEVTRIVADPQDVDCEGVLKKTSLVPLTVKWDRKLQCWQADCGDSSVVVNMSGHYRGPSLAVA
jgi:hypothetical protein